MALRNYTNISREGQLLNPIDSSTGTIALSGSGLVNIPTIPFYVKIDPETASEELVLVGAGSTATTLMNCTRGFDGTTASSHLSAAKVRHCVAAEFYNKSDAHVEASTNVHGLSGGAAVVGTTQSQTLTNKTVNSSIFDVAHSTSPAAAQAYKASADSASARDGFSWDNTGSSTGRAFVARSAGSDKFTVAGSTGNIVTTGTTTSAGVTNTGTLTQTGAVNITGNVEQLGTLHTSLGVDFDSTLNVDGNTTLGGTLAGTSATFSGEVIGNGVEGRAATASNALEAADSSAGNAVNFTVKGSGAIDTNAGITYDKDEQGLLDPDTGAASTKLILNVRDAQSALKIKNASGTDKVTVSAGTFDFATAGALSAHSGNVVTLLNGSNYVARSNVTSVSGAANQDVRQSWTHYNLTSTLVNLGTGFTVYHNFTFTPKESCHVKIECNAVFAHTTTSASLQVMRTEHQILLRDSGDTTTHATGESMGASSIAVDSYEAWPSVYPKLCPTFKLTGGTTYRVKVQGLEIANGASNYGLIRSEVYVTEVVRV